MPRRTVNSSQEAATLEAPVTEEKSDMTEVEFESTDAPAAEAEETVEETEVTEPAPDLDALNEPFKTMALSMFGIAKTARDEYVKIYDVLTKIGDPEAFLAAKRNASSNEDVAAKVKAAAELQEQINALYAEADTILRETGEVSIPTPEEQEKLREEQKTFKTTFDDTVGYADDHIVSGFTRHFAPLPGVRGRRKGSVNIEPANTTTTMKPQLKGVTLDGTRLMNDKGKGNFTVLAQTIKAKTGKTVPIGDLHNAWLSAAGTDNVEEIQDDVSFPFNVDGTQMQIVIERGEAK